MKFKLLQFANNAKVYEKTYEREKPKWLMEFARFCRNRSKNCIDSWEHTNFRCICSEMCNTCAYSLFTASCDNINFADECKLVSGDKNDSRYIIN